MEGGREGEATAEVITYPCALLGHPPSHPRRPVCPKSPLHGLIAPGLTVCRHTHTNKKTEPKYTRTAFHKEKDHVSISCILGHSSAV